MNWFLYLSAFASFLSGILALLTATTIMHQIAAGVAFLNASVLFVGGAILTAMEKKAKA